METTSACAAAALAMIALAVPMAAAALDDPSAASLGEEALPAATPVFGPSGGTVKLGRARSGTPLAGVRVNGADAELGVDTGAGLTVITESLARRVAARDLPGVTPATKDVLGQDVEARLAAVDLEIGALRFAQLPVLVVPDARLGATILGIKLFSFEGLLGWHALKGVRAVLDFEAGTLVLAPASTACGARSLWSRGFKPLVEARVAGTTVTAQLDTGARRTWALAGRLPWDRIVATTPSSSVVAGAGGTSLQATEEASDVALSLGGRSLTLPTLSVRRGVPGAAHELSVGMDVLGRGRMTLDFTCGEFRLEPGAGP